MAIFFCLMMTGLTLFGPMVSVIAYAFSAERSTQGSGPVWTIATILLCVLLTGGLIAIDLSGLFLSIMVVLFGTGSPFATDWHVFGWLAIPTAKMMTATAAATVAAWLWPRPRGRYASFSIAIGLIAFAYETWSHLVL